MREKKNVLVAYQSGDKFVLRRMVETLMDAEEYVRLCNSSLDRESEAQAILDESKDKLELLRQDHKVILNLQPAAKMLRDREVAKAKLEVAHYEAKQKRKGN